MWPSPGQMWPSPGQMWPSPGSYVAAAAKGGSAQPDRAAHGPPPRSSRMQFRKAAPRRRASRRSPECGPGPAALTSATSQGMRVCCMSHGAYVAKTHVALGMVYVACCKPANAVQSAVLVRRPRPSLIRCPRCPLGQWGHSEYSRAYFLRHICLAERPPRGRRDYS